MSELREALNTVNQPGELREALDAAKGTPAKGPIEVWLYQLTTGFGIGCRVVHDDESTETLDVDSPSMRGAQREMTGWFIRQGYKPVGRWEAVSAGEHGSTREAMRVFR